MELIEKYKAINKNINRITYTISSPVAELPYGQICFVYDDNGKEYSINKQYRESKSQLWNRLMGKWI